MKTRILMLCVALGMASAAEPLTIDELLASVDRAFPLIDALVA